MHFGQDLNLPEKDFAENDMDCHLAILSLSN